MFIVWAIWGGFILHILLSNYLAVLIQPTYNKPIKTVDDVLESGLEVFYTAGGSFLVDLLKKSLDSRYQDLAKIIYIPDNTDEENAIIEAMHQDYSWVFMSMRAYDWEQYRHHHWYQGDKIDR